MANFKKKPVSADRVALVEIAANEAPLLRNSATYPGAVSGILSDGQGLSIDLVKTHSKRQELVATYEVGSVYEIALGKIKSNPFNPRAVYTSSAVDDMASSMLAGGQRISATAFIDAQGDVVLIEGETRLRGARAAGLTLLRVEIRPHPASDRELYEEARAANVERREQSPLDDAIKWKELLAKKIYPTQKALAQALGLGDDHVSRTLSLANLPTRIIHAAAEHQELLSHKMLNAIREYWSVKGDDDTFELILDVAKNGMGYRDVAARRKAAENGPVRRARSNRVSVKFKDAAGELKSFAEEGRIELVLRGLNPVTSEELTQKILTLFKDSGN